MSVLKKLNVLYCHGLGSSVNDLHAVQLQAFFDKHDDVYFERFAYKNPGSLDHIWRVSEWKSDIEKRIAGDKWVLIGSSGGCHASLNVAKQHPENVLGLFMMCPAGHLQIEFTNTMAPGALDLMRKGKTLVYPATKNGLPTLVNLEGFQEFLDTCISKPPGPIEINCPVTIVHGTRDRQVPFESSVSLRKRLTSKNVDFLMLEGKKHFFDIDETVQKKLEEFLQLVQDEERAKL